MLDPRSVLYRIAKGRYPGAYQQGRPWWIPEYEVDERPPHSSDAPPSDDDTAVVAYVERRKPVQASSLRPGNDPYHRRGASWEIVAQRHQRALWKPETDRVLLKVLPAIADEGFGIPLVEEIAQVLDRWVVDPKSEECGKIVGQLGL
jgi:hypothetical protein